MAGILPRVYCSLTAIHAIRLEVAYAMMKEGRRKIADVCAAVGFKNQSHFSTAFKRMYGVPPTAV